MSEPVPVGDLLDSLGVNYFPEEGELAIGALVLLKYVDDDGQLGLRMLPSEGMNWLDRLGMLRAAEQVEVQGLNQATKLHGGDE